MEISTRKYWFSRLFGCLVGLGLMFGLWYLFVVMPRGQLFDELAMRDLAVRQFGLTAWKKYVLQDAYWWVVGGLWVLSVLVTLYRGRLKTLIKLVMFNALAMGASQVLKYTILYRPDLNVVYPIKNSLPSGHTTIMAAAALSLLIAAAYRYKGVLAWAASLLISLVGALLVLAMWHRPADILAAYLLVFALAVLMFKEPERDCLQTEAWLRAGQVIGGVTLLFGGAIWGFYTWRIHQLDRVVQEGSWRWLSLSQPYVRSNFAFLSVGTLLVTFGCALLAVCLLTRLVSLRSSR